MALGARRARRHRDQGSPTLARHGRPRDPGRHHRVPGERLPRIDVFAVSTPWPAERCVRGHDV
ncbi:hypothetical protein QJS66_02150 [Kocuria rhizophila]|nr:hypothetical protein QJS66_02150 [Kocuria rhizophila]